MSKIILHITPHLGGGVGTVLLNYLECVKNDENFEHIIYCLDYANDIAQTKSQEIGFTLIDNAHLYINELLIQIEKSDIVLIHFWNHPLLYNFLIRNKLPKCRLIIWSHISGLTPPNVFNNNILNYPDKFVFTTPMSFHAKEIINFDKKDNISYIWATSKLDTYYNLEHINTKNFNVLYVGTVDYAKMYPRFLEMNIKINIDNIKFIVCGGPNNLHLEKEAERLGVKNKFNFLGKVSDIKPYLQISNVFGYPLNKNHFGTCDQCIQEAMSAGLVPVVFDNLMEKYMVKEYTGFVCSSEDEYIKSIEKLYNDRKLLLKMSENSKIYAIKEFSLKKMVEEWNNVFEKVLIIEKTEKKWNINKTNLKTKDIFFESLGEYRNIFELEYSKLKEEMLKPNWASESKGSIKQYKFFLDDGSLDKYIMTY